MPARNLTLLQTVAHGFGELRQKVVFVGGVTLELYVTDEAAPEARPTEDVDCIAAVPSLLEFYRWEEALPAKGFQKHPRYTGRLRAWVYEGIRVNITPIHTESLGFSNRWYEEAVFHASSFPLPDGTPIKILNPAYWLATKIEAFRQRGEADLRLSEDFEDILYLLDNRREIIEDVAEAFYAVRTYILEFFRELLRRPDLEEGIYQTLPMSSADEGIAKIRHQMEEIAAFEVSLI